MLKKLITAENCKNCRICCGFYESERWEIPVVFKETKDYIENETDLKCGFLPKGDEFVFEMDFRGDNYISLCPALDDEKGCVLGDKKPFDCKIWPFRVMDRNGTPVLTMSPLCKVTQSKSVGEISAFAADGFAELCFEQARKHKEIVKPYIKGYPVFAFGIA